MERVLVIWSAIQVKASTASGRSTVTRVAILVEDVGAVLPQHGRPRVAGDVVGRGEHLVARVR